MTKKVLISLDELQDIISSSIIDDYYEGWVNYESIVNDAEDSTPNPPPRNG